jgi:hypothetical protein
MPERTPAPQLEPVEAPPANTRAPYEAPHLEPHAAFTVLTGESLIVVPPAP